MWRVKKVIQSSCELTILFTLDLTLGAVKARRLNTLVTIYLLTGAEIRYVWARAKRRKSTYMFFLHRYFALLGNVSVTVFSFMNLDPKVSVL